MRVFRKLLVVILAAAYAPWVLAATTYDVWRTRN